ncbi:MAG TPA: 30S ribosomal protein S2 [Patescibacteria group bacterium]|nr:30S ribosomal protein S2 [Patescibacteria group bacterium]
MNPLKKLVTKLKEGNLSELLSFFDFPRKIMTKYSTPKLKDMLDAGVHFGHRARRWNPKMEKYIYTVSKNVHIIDLEQSEDLLKKACEALFDIAKKGGKVIFVGTKKQARQIIESEAKNCGAMYITERWIGGTITNFDVIRKTLDKFLTMIRNTEDGTYEKEGYTKKERLLIDRQIGRFQINYGGIANMRGTPHALVVVDQRRERTAIKEAKKAGVPVIGLIDTNADPTGIDYPIPGNDDAIKSIALIVNALAGAVKVGYEEFEKDQKEEAGKKLKEAAK